MSELSPRTDWQQANHVLCVRLDAMGDVLMTTPAIRALREANPSRQITLLTSTSGARAAALIPWVDDVIVYEAPWMKSAAPENDLGRNHAMLELIERAAFDAAVIFTVYSQSPLPGAYLCYLAGIPLRLAHCRENPYQLLTDWIAEPEPQSFVRHEVRRQLDLVSAVGCRLADERMSIRVPDQARNCIDAWLKSVELSASDRWVVIHPGSTAPSRRYPPESFAEVARRLVLEHGIRVVFTGGMEECDLIAGIRRIMGDAPSISVAGSFDLGELAALIARAPLLVSNNAGPVHVAASVGTPVVDLYALTNPQHTPWGVRHRVLNHDVPCKYCYKSICPEEHHHCLRLIKPEQIVDATLELMHPSDPEASSSPAMDSMGLSTPPAPTELPA